MTESLTGESIWNALKGEPGFLSQVPESAHQSWKELCLAAGPVIGPYADLLLTASSLISTKLAVLRMMVEGRWMQKILSAHPDDAFAGGKEVMVEMAGGLLEELVEQLANAVGDDPDKWIAALGVTDEQLLMDPKGGRLTLDTAIRWRAGGFTIGDLATTQPSAFFRND